MKKLRIVVLTMLMALVVMAGCATSVQAAAKPKLSNKKVSIYVGKTKTIKLKNANKKVKWSTSNKKIKIVKKSGKYSSTVKIQGKKKGSVKLTAKVNGKKYVCKVTVKQKAANKTNNNASTGGNYNNNTNTSGGNSNTGTSTVNSKFAYLKNYILTYGSTNTDGYKFISHTDYETGVKTGIVYNSSESKFSFTMTFVNDSSQLGVNMEISEYNTGSADIKCVVYDELYGYGCITYNALTTSTYYKDQTLYFIIDTIVGMTDSDAQKLSNSGVNLAMTTWEYVLVSQPGLSLNELGFTSYNY